jgi:hypothetical protein
MCYLRMLMVCVIAAVCSQMIMVLMVPMVLVVLPLVVMLAFWCMAGRRLRLGRCGRDRAARLSVSVISVHHEHP